MKSLLRTAAAAAAVTALLSFSAMAAQGWTQENNNWVYYENGYKVVNDWRTSKDGSYYYLDGGGNMAVNSFIDYERYVDSDGKMVTNGWRQIDNKWYYFDANGKIIRSKSKQINGVYYFFTDEGYMATGWTQDDEGNWYYCDPSDGHRLTSQWKNLIPDEKLEGDETSIDDNGNYWYYFLSNGRMATADGTGDYKEYLINNARYVFDSNGRLRTGWVKISDTNPAIAGYKFYNDDTSIGVFGAAHTGWLSVVPPEEDKFSNEVSWFYFDSKGVPYYGTDVSGSGDEDATLQAKLKRITKDGKTYTFLFNEYGNPVYGLRKVRKSDGSVTSMYYGTKQECCLQLGEKHITEADGTYWPYHFESNGYGTNGVKNGKLYYMGKLQKAIDSSYAYYTVNGKTYLVNKSGSLVKNYHKSKDPNEVEYRSNSEGIMDGGSAGIEELLVPVFTTDDV